MSDLKSKLALYLFFIVGACFLNGCGQAPAQSLAPSSPSSSPPVSVGVVQPHRGSVYRFINLPGEVRPYLQVTLYAKVDGYLDNLTVDKGDSVKPGDLIADIDVPELRANKIKFTAEVELAEAEYKQISEAPTNHPATATAEESEAAQNRIAVAKGRLSVAKANLEYTESMLDYARVTAPFDGIITKRYVDPGAYIPVPNAADTPEAAAIVTVTDFKTLRLQVAVPETESPHIQIGQPIRWTTDDFPGRNFDGTVTRAYWALEQATRTMLTEVQMTNPDMLLKPGMLVNARIGLERKDDALLVPISALVQEKENAFVFKADAGKVLKTSVQTGFNDGTNVEISAGLDLANWVVITPQSSLQDGQTVTMAGGK